MTFLGPVRWVVVFMLAMFAHRMPEPPKLITAWANADAAYAAEDTHFSAILLLRIAHHESRFDPTALGSLGGWHHLYQPKGVSELHCGVTQADASTWKSCLELRDIWTSYTETVRELEEWRASRNCRWRRDASACALAGYRRGNAGAQSEVERFAAADDLRATRR